MLFCFSIYAIAITVALRLSRFTLTAKRSPHLLKKHSANAVQALWVMRFIRTNFKNILKERFGAPFCCVLCIKFALIIGNLY